MNITDATTDGPTTNSEGSSEPLLDRLVRTRLEQAWGQDKQIAALALLGHLATLPEPLIRRAGSILIQIFLDELDDVPAMSEDVRVPKLASVVRAYLCTNVAHSRQGERALQAIADLVLGPTHRRIERKGAIADIRGLFALALLNREIQEDLARPNEEPADRLELATLRNAPAA